MQELETKCLPGDIVGRTKNGKRLKIYVGDELPPIELSAHISHLPSEAVIAKGGFRVTYRNVDVESLPRHKRVEIALAQLRAKKEVKAQRRL